MQRVQAYSAKNEAILASKAHKPGWNGKHMQAMPSHEAKRTGQGASGDSCEDREDMPRVRRDIRREEGMTNGLKSQILKHIVRDYFGGPAFSTELERDAWRTFGLKPSTLSRRVREMTVDGALVRDMRSPGFDKKPSLCYFTAEKWKQMQQMRQKQMTLEKT